MTYLESDCLSACTARPVHCCCVRDGGGDDRAICTEDYGGEQLACAVKTGGNSAQEDDKECLRKDYQFQPVK